MGGSLCERWEDLLKMGLGEAESGRALERGEHIFTFGEFGVLDLHLQLSEENVLCRVLAQVTEKDLERGHVRGREGAGDG